MLDFRLQSFNLWNETLSQPEADVYLKDTVAGMNVLALAELVVDVPQLTNTKRELFTTATLFSLQNIQPWCWLCMKPPAALSDLESPGSLPGLLYTSIVFHKTRTTRDGWKQVSSHVTRRYTETDVWLLFWKFSSAVTYTSCPCGLETHKEVIKFRFYFSVVWTVTGFWLCTFRKYFCC